MAATEYARIRITVGNAANALADAIDQLSLVRDQVPALEQRIVVDDVRWHALEAQHLLRHFTVSIDRLAGATRPEGSPHTSMHDPPETDAPKREAPP